MNQLVALAIGHGILGIDPKVTISDAYSHLLVKKDGEIVGTTFRVSTCKTTGTVELMPCYHKMTWLQTDFYQKHRGDCAYCDYHTASEDHIFENGECTVCGYKGTAGEGVYKVTVYKAPTAQGTGYDGGTTYIVAKDNDFEVPYIYRKDVPDDMVFMDWKQVTNDNDIPETWEMKDGETLVESGSAIKIAADTKLYARYRYQYVETWDWAADYSSATLHIECGNDVQAPAVTVSSSVMTDDKTGISYTEYVATATYERAPGYTYTFTDTHTVPLYAALTLSDDEDNTQTIAEHADPAKRYYVMLCDRTLYKDGSWNTLCLPFDVENLDDSPLAGATVKALSSASFANSTLTLNFADVIDIEAGRPYLIKWFSDDNIVDPVFTNVTIQSEVNDKVCDIGDAKAVTFKGTYKKLAYDTENRSILFLGGGNTLYFPPAVRRPHSDHRCPARLLPADRHHGRRSCCRCQPLRAELRRRGNHFSK